MKDYIRDFIPPILLRSAQGLRGRVVALRPTKTNGTEQDLDIYWDPKMAEMLDRRGEGNAWNDIQLLMAGCKGRVLDIALRHRPHHGAAEEQSRSGGAWLRHLEHADRQGPSHGEFRGRGCL